MIWAEHPELINSSAPLAVVNFEHVSSNGVKHSSLAGYG